MTTRDDELLSSIFHNRVVELLLNLIGQQTIDMVTHNGSQKKTTPTEKEDDALQWMEASSQGRPYDPTMVQIDLL